MDFLDYRKKLNIAFDNKNMVQYFMVKIFNVLEIASEDIHSGCLDYEEYFSFCNTTGTEIDLRFSNSHNNADRFRFCISILQKHRSDLADFLSYYMSLTNSVKVEKFGGWKRENFANLIQNMLTESHLPYEVLHVEDNYFIFPKGAKELDDALVSEPLFWLKDYPAACRTYTTALKQYADGIYIRDVADNLRKSLEAFLQEFLGNTKNLESNKTEICKYLGQQGVDSGISGLFQPLINAYKNINDRIAKHNDYVDEKLLEFLLYQTGVLIRMVLSVKRTEGKPDAD